MTFQVIGQKFHIIALLFSLFLDVLCIYTGLPHAVLFIFYLHRFVKKINFIVYFSCRFCQKYMGKILLLLNGAKQKTKIVILSTFYIEYFNIVKCLPLKLNSLIEIILRNQFKSTYLQKKSNLIRLQIEENVKHIITNNEQIKT